jgi:hypothetical protein
MRKIAILICLLAVVPVTFVQAQNSTTRPEVHYYHLEFVVKELGDDGKVINSRVYNTNVSSDNDSPISSVRTGTKVPVKTNDKGEINYIDLGVNLDCKRVKDTPQGVAIEITAEISSLSKAPADSDAVAPIIRQNRWQGDPLLTLGKPTIIFSSDNLDNKGRMQVEVTATPVR